MTHVSAAGARWRSFPIVCLGLTVLTTNILTPTLVGTYVDSFGLSIGQAGYTAAAYMLGGGLGGMLVSWLLLIVPTRVLLIIGLASLALGNFVSIFVAALPGILAVRMIAGIGEGIGFGLMGACISRLPNPGRIYGVFTVLLLLISALILYLLPGMRSEFGPRMILVPIAVAPACLLAIIRKFPDLSSQSRSSQRTTAPGDGPSLARRSWFVPLATFVIYVAYGAQFSYAERLGVYAGIAPNSVARLLAIASLVALVGAILATLLSNSRAMGLKISIALVIVVCCTWAMVAGNPALYRVGIVVFFCAWFFFLPNLFALVSLVDRNGQVAAATLGAMEWGMAAGPAIVAFWVSERTLSVIGPIATVGFGVGLLLLAPAMRNLSRSRPEIDPAVNVA
jgi:DHA1 family inner membrane transport protein